MVSRAEHVRRVGNLVNGSSLLGLAVARLGRTTLRPGERGLLLAEGYRFDFPRAGAFTVGNVIVTAGDFRGLVEVHPDVMDHENAHAWQYFWCGGLPFLPLYLAAAGWSWLRTGDPASANFFERRAGLLRGGYHQAPTNNAGFRRLARRVQTLIEKPSRLAERSL